MHNISVVQKRISLNPGGENHVLAWLTKTDMHIRMCTASLNTTDFTIRFDHHLKGFYS